MRAAWRVPVPRVAFRLVRQENRRRVVVCQRGGSRQHSANGILGEYDKYIRDDRFYEIRILDDKLIEKLNAEGQKRWGNYLRERKKLMEQFEGKTLWQ